MIFYTAPCDIRPLRFMFTNLTREKNYHLDLYIYISSHSNKNKHLNNTSALIQSYIICIIMKN